MITMAMMATMTIQADNITVIGVMTITAVTTMIVMTAVIMQSITATATGMMRKTGVMPGGTHTMATIATTGILAVISHPVHAIDTVVLNL
jgi:hypothetical protein